MTCEAWDVVTVPFPFTDRASQTAVLIPFPGFAAPPTNPLTVDFPFANVNGEAIVSSSLLSPAIAVDGT